MPPLASAPTDLDAHLRAALLRIAGEVRTGESMRHAAGAPLLWRVFDAQVRSRHSDFAARRMRSHGAGFYTISSAGHESNAAIAAALRPTDPALLHYRSGAFYLLRATECGFDGVQDILLGVAAAVDEPIAGGRHKVLGRAELGIIPTTSTIASHLPRALGIAFAIDRGRELGQPCRWPADSIVMCSFGDASANHSTAAGAINAAGWCAHQRVRLPLLFVCEDNGLGISVRTPRGWTRSSLAQRAAIRYFSADGFDTEEVYAHAAAAAAFVREERRPALLHLSTVRFLGHAGSDVETAYRSRADVAADYRRDPILGTGHALATLGVPGTQLLARYDSIAGEVTATMARCLGRANLSDAAAVMAPLTAIRADAVAKTVSQAAPTKARRAVFGDTLPENEGGLTLAETVNRALADLGARHSNVLIFGEDVARKGGVYGVTRGLQRRLGARRVFDTLLDEQTILGLALGASIAGFLPIPEIQYLAYLHNAEDQLRGEAASQGFFSQGQFANPMVVRIAGYAYQRGFGGHFHNDNSVAVLRDIPGLVLASPSHPRDAAPMLRTCLAAAQEEGRVSVFLEPIALYHTRDLYEPGDGGWLAPYAPPEQWAEQHIPVGRARRVVDGADLTIVTFGNGVPMSLRAVAALGGAGIECALWDLRWLVPLPIDDLLEAANTTGRVLVVDETRRSGGVSEAVLAALVDGGFSGPMRRVTSEDTFIPLGPAADTVLLREDAIEGAVREMLAPCQVMPRNT